MRYRIWYGNGQVSDSTPDLAAAELELLEAQRDCPGARLSRYEGNGDWSIRTTRGDWTVLL